jgi:3-hydroxyisobutyrate dehydrogenase-like beta-hydroxyacid dehydrogenase
MAHLVFLGTGLLGSGMVRRFLKNGREVTVWNRTSEKAVPLRELGASIAETPQEAVSAADEIHFVFADDAVVDNVLDQIQGSLRPDSIVVDHSTTLPKLTAQRFERLKAQGVAFLHAPVFMSPKAAEDGGGLMLVSGPQPTFAAVQSTLDQMAGDLWYLGDRPDLAAAYKLFGNAMLFAINAGLADVMAMARANDVDPMDVVGLFRRFQVANGIQVRGPKMAKGDFTPSFAMSMARKDLGLMLEAADGEPLVVLPSVGRRMDEVIASGGGGLDLAALARGPRA